MILPATFFSCTLPLASAHLEFQLLSDCQFHKVSVSKMTIACEAGKVITDMKGELNGYRDVCYTPKAIKNVLSFANINAKYIISA